MIQSIKQFLVISLLISITIASSITAIGNYVLDKQVIRPYLDEQLINCFSFLEVLAQTKKISLHHSPYPLNLPTPSVKSLFFEVLDQHGKLILHSKDHLAKIFQDAPIGFSDQTFEDNNWRIYAAYDKNKQYKIIVAELYDIRKQLADDIARNNAYILLVSYPIFGILIWLIVSAALRPITRITKEISHRASTYLEPVDASDVAIEVRPLVMELNQLFIRLQLAFDRNKRFSADAAHELRTPLAVLKTHAQVALKAENDLERRTALLKLIQGVDRSSHVVAQLLTLSRLTKEGMPEDKKITDLHKLTSETIALLVPTALEKNIDIELTLPPKHSLLLANETTLGVLIRNIIDNAIRYTPKNGTIQVQILNQDDKLILRVIDTGPGIHPELHERVFERFFRILGTSAPGSGLGLAIVSQIAELHGAKIKLDTPPSGIGLQFDVIFPLL